MNNCEFCQELSKIGISTFNKIYSKSVPNRIISESSSFAILPTLGQLFDHSLLILPKNHIETLGDLSFTDKKELSEILNEVYTYLSPIGHVVAFEHGAHQDCGGSCGIYHAHLHVIPLPEETSLFPFLKHNYNLFSSIVDALKSAGGANEYLLAIDSLDRIGLLDVDGLSEHYESQYFRRCLATSFNISDSWNWRDYDYPEEKLINIVKNPILPEKIL